MGKIFPLALVCPLNIPPNIFERFLGSLLCAVKLHEVVTTPEHGIESLFLGHGLSSLAPE